LRRGFIIINEDFTEDEKAKMELEAQLTSIKRKPHQARVDEIESKKDMSARGIKSPDRADSVAMRYGAMSGKSSFNDIAILHESVVHSALETNSPFLTDSGASPWD
jgi:hypothetical protein